MLRITVELVPMGIEAHKKLLGKIVIYNTLGGTKELGQYGFRRYSATDVHMTHYDGDIGEFHRKNHSSWRLLKGVLDIMFPDKEGVWKDGSPKGKLHSA